MMDVKSSPLRHPQPPSRATLGARNKVVVTVIVLVLLALASLKNNIRGCILRVARGVSGEQDDGELTWADIEPSRSLQWHGCFQGQYDCARLDLPMDWLDPSEEHRVIIAVIRLRATNYTDYRGPVFTNPGGPGGSGVWALRQHGRNLQTIVGDNHDIVSFDPRGIGASVPRIECWDTVQGRRFWDLRDVGVVDAHPGTLYDVFARATAYSQLCRDSLEPSGILHHSSTTYHARDMLEILDRMGQEKLKYWGFSYGTILGGTFASMYPDRIERLVSDGNVDYNEWYFNSHINFLRDTDKVMHAFYHFCHLAGPSKCALYAPSPEEVQARVDALLERIKVSPVIVQPNVITGPEIPEIISYSRVRRLISTTLYQPVRMFARTATALAALEKGDGEPLYQYYLAGSDPSSLCSLETVPPTEPASGSDEDTGDAFPAILCSDAEPSNLTIEEMELHAERLQEISRAAGSVLVLFRMACVGRTVRPKWRFAGPFGGNTSFPILFVANAADNVTPLVSARNNSAAFPGSTVLVQNSYGHTSLSAASTCTAGYIRNYFQTGVLPAPDAVCEPDVAPFDLEVEGQQDSDADEDDAELSKAIQELARDANWAGLFKPPHL